MTKKYVYDVAGFEFHDTEAFGKAWKEAKAEATKRHCAIYRDVINEDETQTREVYTGGMFLPIQMVEAHKVKIF